MSGQRLSREAIAREEIGHTEVGRGLAVTLTLLFLLAVFLVPGLQYYLDRSGHGKVNPLTIAGSTENSTSVFQMINSANKNILKNIDQLETALEEESFLRTAFLPPLQYFYARFAGQGNEKVVVGKDGWLFYRPGVDAIVGQPFLGRDQLSRRVEGKELWQQPVQPDPVTAIVDFRDQLKQRGIELLVVPVPVKVSLHPEKLSSRSIEIGLRNRDTELFLQRLANAGVAYYDPRPILVEYVREQGAAFLRSDTHWLPGAMEAVAKGLGLYIWEHSFLDADSVQNDTALFQVEELEFEGLGDIGRMMTLPEERELYPLQKVRLNQILTQDGEFWQPDRNGELLLLGDSFTNIYSVPSLGWGIGAGFAEHLCYELQQPIDLLARNDSGAYVTREMLSQELSRGRDRLDGKKLVVWEFAERELAFGDWKDIALQLGTAEDSGFLVVESGVELTVIGTVAEISRSPRPGSVPYRDNIVTLHLVDIHALDSNEKLDSEQALVYGFGMRDNSLTGLAALRPNDIVKIQLTSWDDAEKEFGSFRRSPLDDEMMELEIPNWGKIENEKSN